MKIKFLFILVLHCFAISLFAQSYQLSPLFGDNGVSHTNSWPGNEHFNSHLTQPDGKLLLGGYGYWNSPNSFYIKMMRIDTVCGVPDVSFGNDGVVSFTFEQRTKLNGIALQPDGAIVGCGMTAPSNAGSQQKPSVFRLLPDGTPDTTFFGTGYHKTSFDPISAGHLWDPFVLEDGRIVCAGAARTNINGGANRIGAMRFLPDGSLDTAFAADGITSINLGGTGYTWAMSAEAGRGLLQPDGKIISIGMGNSSGNNYIVMARFNIDGSPDTTFGDQGLLLTDVSLESSSFKADGMGAALHDDGRILVSGRSPSPYQFMAVRFMPDGSLDVTYGNNGISLIDIPGFAQNVGMKISLLEDGSTLQFGTRHWSSGPPVIVKRLADGSVDTSFGNDGIQVVPMPAGSSNDKFWGGLHTDEGRIIGYGGDGNSGLLAARITTTPDDEYLVDLGGDVEICPGDMAEFDAANPGATYLWHDNTTAQTFSAAEAGMVSVTVTTSDGCVDSDEAEVLVLEAPDAPFIESGNGIDLSAEAEGDLQWFLNGEEIPGATDNEWTALENGSYTLVVTNDEGCSSESEPYQVVSVGIHTHKAPAVQIWPNPASDMVQVSGTTVWERAEAIDLSGKTFPLSIAPQGQINVVHLSSGSYVLRLTSAHEVAVARMLKME